MMDGIGGVFSLHTFLSGSNSLGNNEEVSTKMRKDPKSAQWIKRSSRISVARILWGDWGRENSNWFQTRGFIITNTKHQARTN